ncbi:RipA family octameric membrane protein [Streptomyces sp. NPDC002911]
MTTPSEPVQRAEVLELYKLAVEMADRVSARRGTANAFFLSVQTALISLVGLGFKELARSPWWAALAMALAGVTLSATWWLQLRSYRDLNAAKFKGINKIEELLPVKIFADEWEALRRDPIVGWRKRYAELGTSERVVPLVFVAVHLLLLVGTLTV